MTREIGVLNYLAKASDQTARNCHEAPLDAGLPLSAYLPMNAVPWYDGTANAASLREGATYNAELIRLHGIERVILFGYKACPQQEGHRGSAVAFCAISELEMPERRQVGTRSEWPKSPAKCEFEAAPISRPQRTAGTAGRAAASGEAVNGGCGAELADLYERHHSRQTAPHSSRNPTRIFINRSGRYAAETRAVVVLALHDLNQVVRTCTTTIALASSRIIATGLPLEVLTPDLIRQLYGIDSRVERCSQGYPMMIVGGSSAQAVPSE